MVFRQGLEKRPGGEWEGKGCFAKWRKTTLLASHGGTGDPSLEQNGSLSDRWW